MIASVSELKSAVSAQSHALKREIIPMVAG